MTTLSNKTSETPRPVVGALLRTARRNRDLTLQELSSLADLSVGYLSQVERDIATPSLGSLSRLAAALELELGHFISIPNTRGLTTSAKDRETIRVREGGMTYQQLHGEFVGASFSAFLITLPAGFTTETDQHFGEEFIEVRSGRVIFEIDGQTYDLEAGDTLHFRSDLRHQARNPENFDAVVFWLGNGPTFQQRAEIAAVATDE
ncbi:Helix-turn-helix [Monaibacterium marinum]|uniref:Helix-turn-helix n=1 Tax=Pontivivens marinum TaxID=1690039 RepID=A0A2C9CWJ3_9RHOB|nr:XRE family transcriptional regulator [Monaibacterium marinum]SOH95664.1 Helix-turn-helix [Monaibacterium marinum]